MTRRKLPLILCIATVAAACAIVGIAQTATNAPAAFATPLDNAGNGAVGNGFTPAATFVADTVAFSNEEDIPQGIGPTFNARGCVDCHMAPNIGGSSQVTELRVGHLDGAGNFVNPNIPVGNTGRTVPARSLVNDRAVCGQAQERVPGAENVRALRASLNVLGDGFVEAIDSNTLVAIANAQPGQSGGAIAGQFIQVPVAEANGAVRGGRFGWKNQQASLLSFSSDAYINEQGITNRFNLTENTSLGRFVGFGSGFDPVPDNAPCASNPSVNCGEDPEEDIVAFARFMRATKAPPRGPGAEDGSNGAPN